jgi:hypothetical protein
MSGSWNAALNASVVVPAPNTTPIYRTRTSPSSPDSREEAISSSVAANAVEPFAENDPRSRPTSPNGTTTSG